MISREGKSASLKSLNFFLGLQTPQSAHHYKKRVTMGGSTPRKIPGVQHSFSLLVSHGESGFHEVGGCSHLDDRLCGLDGLCGSTEVTDVEIVFDVNIP